MILKPQHIDTTQPLRTVICIVGAGAAGITLACELDGAGVPVLLLDAGPIHLRRAPSQEPYEGTSEGAHPTPHHFRRRGFGGTTAIWGGRCVPFDPIDFETREHVPHSGWPIRYDEVARHYPRAMQYCDAGAFEFDDHCALAQVGTAVPGLDNSRGIVADTIERYSLPTHFGRRYRARLAASGNVRVLGPATALRLRRAASGGHIETLECRLGGRDGDGPATAPLQVQAQHFVLAAGGIETTRLLLASDRAHGGLGNEFDQLGRYYGCHVENVLGVLRPTAAARARPERVAFHFEITRDGVYARRRLLVAPEAQRRERTVNISFRLHYPDVSDPGHGSSVLSAVFVAKRLLIPEYRRILQHGRGDGPVPGVRGGHLLNIARGLPGLLAFGCDWVRRHQLAERKLPYVLVPNADGSHVLEFNAEQSPQADSRIMLGDTLDSHGTPRVHVRWRMAGDDVDGICRAYRLLRNAIAAGGAYRLDFDDTRLHETVAASIPLGGHHIGSTRMAESPRRGVVDSRCAVFGLPNLHIASASVFPTSSHANPTLTIVALAIRLAAHLRTRVALQGAVA